MTLLRSTLAVGDDAMPGMQINTLKLCTQIVCLTVTERLFLNRMLQNMGLISGCCFHRQSIFCDNVDFKRKSCDGISTEAKEFVSALLNKDPRKRPTAKQVLYASLLDSLLLLVLGCISLPKLLTS